jgi:hypothetical protein
MVMRRLPLAKPEQVNIDARAAARRLDSARLDEPETFVV